MNCSICKEKIIIPDGTNTFICSKNIAVKQGDTYICNACHEASMLFCMNSTPKKQKTEVKTIKKVVTSKTKFLCAKCKVSYEGNICNNCNTPNPLFKRKAKKKKKKKKKESKKKEL